jgi:hypothetical protein
MNRRISRRLLRLTQRTLEAGAAGVFLGAVAHHAYAWNLKPLAAFCLPVLVAFFGFTSLLYMRGRSLSRGRDQLRTLLAAERAMQAAIWYFTGIVAAMAMYGIVQLLGIGPGSPALLVLLAPAVLMQAGLVLFMRAAWLIAPQFIRRVSTQEIWRRVRHQPG